MLEDAPDFVPVSLEDHLLSVHGSADSIASLIKRIAVICMAIVWFGQTVYPIQAVGICMTFLGLWMYQQAKTDVERGESVRTKVERRGSVLLPTTKEDLSDSELSGSKAKGWTIVR